MTRFWIVGLCAALLAGVAGAAAPAGDDWETYRNDKFGYELSYPAGMNYKAHLDGSSGELTDARTGRRLADFEVWPPGECPRQPAGASAREIGIERAMTITQADGPDGSSHCDDPATVREYPARRGARIFELELTCVRETYPEDDADENDGRTGVARPDATPVITRNGTKGPTYFVDISPPWRKRVLIADPVGVDPRMRESKGTIDPAALRTILGTLHAFPIPKPPGVRIEDLRSRGLSIGIRP
jgi:hypothetical protein